MEQESVNPAIGSILDEQKLKNIVYPAKLFRTRLNEEFMRANRTRKPFLYIKMYSHQYDFFGWGSPNKTVENTWRISILTMFSHLRFIDVLGFLSDGSGIGLIFFLSESGFFWIIRPSVSWFPLFSHANVNKNLQFQACWIKKSVFHNKTRLFPLL